MRTPHLAWLLLIPLTLAPFASVRATAEACAGKAAAMLDALGHEDYATARSHMGAKLQAEPQQKMLVSMWQALLRDSWGPYQSHGAASTVVDDGRATTIRLPLQFARGATTATITCDAEQGGAIDEFVLL